MSLDPRTPVLIGAGQVNQRTEQPTPDSRSDGWSRPGGRSIPGCWRRSIPFGGQPVVVAVSRPRVAARSADQGTGCGDSTPESVATPRNHWSTRPALISRQVGPEVMLLAGRETWRTRMRLQRRGIRPDWTRQNGVRPSAARAGADDVPMAGPTEDRIGLDQPAFVYPDVRGGAANRRRRKSIEDHRRRIGALWARIQRSRGRQSRLPGSREAMTAEQIAGSGAGNRMIGWPYPKLMNSNNAVDPVRRGGAVFRREAQHLPFPTRRHGCFPAQEPIPATPTASPNATNCTAVRPSGSVARGAGTGRCRPRRYRLRRRWPHASLRPCRWPPAKSVCRWAIRTVTHRTVTGGADLRRRPGL